MKTRTLFLIGFLLMTMVLYVPAAEALIVTGGWIRSDIGLEEEGDGFYVGVQESWPMGGELFDFTVAGEYLQKSGSMHRSYSDPHSGETYGKADVSLHCVQPAAFFGLKLPFFNFTSRLYTGASVVLKLGETWDEPEGTTAGDYGYENMDFQVHVGFANEFSNFLVDIRYSYGLMDQLIDQTAQNLYPSKADVVDTPDDGAKISSLQIGVGYKF